MAFINQNNDVVSLTELFGNVLEPINSRDDNFTNILSEHTHQLLNVSGSFQIGHIR